ncbi:MAG: inositol monophosphatase family protein [Desulfosarcinaceae bacterium]
MDLDPIIRTGTRAAYEAGRILNSHFGNVTRIAKKGEIDLVTEADTASEAAIIEVIQKDFPGHTIQAEESGVHQGGDDGRWIVDPLDGTTNFAHRLGIYCVSIAFALGDRLLAGIVLNPATGELFAATRDGGATLNNTPIRVTANAAMQECLLATGFPYDIRQKSCIVLARMERFLMASQGIRRLGAAALDLCHVACGRMDGFWEEGLKPWDMAAGALIVQEAGGRVTDFRDEPYRLSQSDIVASNGLIHNAMITLLQPKDEL